MSRRQTLPYSALLLAALALQTALAAAPASAHPGPGIVVDSRGNVFYTDIANGCIWKLDPEGRETVFAADLHPHHLAIDADDNLYTAAGEGGTVWRFDPAGNRTRYYPWPGGEPVVELGEYGLAFTVAPDGSILFERWRLAEDPREPDLWRIWRIRPGERPRPLAGKQLGWNDGTGDYARFGHALERVGFALGPGGELFVTDGTKVRRVSPEGKVVTVAGGPDPGYRDGERPRFDRLWGIDVDAEGTIWVADSGNRAVRKIAPDGTTTTVHRVEEPWTVIGVAAGPGGSLYSLEVSGLEANVDAAPPSRPRVQRITP